ncbi:MAG: transcription elongation factor GreA [Thermohalobaculum sp.]|jgi:transcription elongation factor GreA
MEKVPITKTGYDALNAELKTKKSIERPAIIKAIAEAREHGDLSENAEYHTAKDRQGFIEGRIKELESLISRADVIDPAKMSGTTIRFGATVELIDENTDQERTYQIVGEPEADINAGRLNMRSPLARALIGKEEGDSVEVAAPGGARSYEVLSVRYV